MSEASRRPICLGARAASGLATTCGLLAAGCMSGGSYTVPRTLGPHQFQHNLALEASTAPQRARDLGGADLRGLTVVPGVNYMARYGLTGWMELGARINTSIVTGADLKVQVVRSRYVDAALDPGFATFIGMAWMFNFPLLLGLNLSERFQLLLAPRGAYALDVQSVGQTSTSQMGLVGASGFYVGGSLGVRVRLAATVAILPEYGLLISANDLRISNPAGVFQWLGLNVALGAQPVYTR
jgi:hypothetical protein